MNKYPLRDTQANYNIVLTWGNPITIESFEALLRRKSHGLDMISREKIIEDIWTTATGTEHAATVANPSLNVQLDPATPEAT